MFVGRHAELNKLNALYQSGKFECAVLYGRRRVGKTTLINEFIKDKDSIFFSALETSVAENLENFSRSIMRFQFGGDAAAPVFSSFHDALDAVYNIALKKRIVLVIDEYPYLAASYRGISSALQVEIDHKYKDSKLMIILCGSSMSFMENQVLGYKSPLYGRRTAQFKIKPFNFFESLEYYPGLDSFAAAVVYGITGGVPLYMEQIDASKSIAENIKNCFFDASAFLYEEPSNLLKQEVREPALYNAVIKAIATGSSRLSQISSKVSLETSACMAYIKNLMALGIIKKEYPFREETSKKTIYALDDSMFRFWYRFVPDNVSLIQNNMRDLVWQKVEPQLTGFMGGVFGEICKQWLWQENIAGRLPFQFSSLGRWWGNDPMRKRETEIDIIAYVSDDCAVFCECKWTGEKVDTGILDSLIQRGELFRYPVKYFYLFSRSGFTTGCIDKAESIGAKFIDFASMVSVS